MCVNISMLQRLSVETMLTYTQYVECHVACKKKNTINSTLSNLTRHGTSLICIINTSSEMLCIISKYIIIIICACSDRLYRTTASQQPMTTFGPRRLFDVSMVARFFFHCLEFDYLKK